MEVLQKRFRTSHCIGHLLGGEMYSAFDLNRNRQVTVWQLQKASAAQQEFLCKEHTRARQLVANLPPIVEQEEPRTLKAIVFDAVLLPVEPATISLKQIATLAEALYKLLDGKVSHGAFSLATLWICDHRIIILGFGANALLKSSEIDADSQSDGRQYLKTVELLIRQTLDPLASKLDRVPLSEEQNDVTSTKAAALLHELSALLARWEV